MGDAAPRDPEAGVRSCRICLEDEGTQWGGRVYGLGCRCRGDMGFAHGPCASRWFKDRASCEICLAPVDLKATQPVGAVCVCVVFSLYTLSLFSIVAIVYALAYPVVFRVAGL